MNKSPRILTRFTTFDIVHPDANESVVADSSNMVFVQVRNKSSANTSFQATISDISGSSGGMSTDLAQEGSSDLFSGMVFAGVVPDVAPTSNNKTVKVQAFQGTATGEAGQDDFIASHGGSGFLLAGQTVPGVAYAQAGPPLPIALSLQLDTPVAAGTCADCDELNQPTLLVYSQDPTFPSCWFSQPIDFCADGTNPGFWMLQKSSAGIWTLLLRRGSVDVVTYRRTTSAPDASALPITLELAGPGGSECKDWPRTVTITPAP